MSGGGHPPGSATRHFGGVRRQVSRPRLWDAGRWSGRLGEPEHSFFRVSLCNQDGRLSYFRTRIKQMLMPGTCMYLRDTVLLVRRFVCDSTVASGSQYINCQSFAVGIQDRFVKGG